MKFAHLADCHVGAWREPKLRTLNEKAFVKAVDISIEEGMDFVLISGDLFNTSIPAFDQLKTVVRKLKALKKKNIPVYVIAGSHDFSPSGKTMLDVLEEAELMKNVVKGKAEDNVLKLNFTTDEKTGAKITGMLGKRGMLEKSYYESLDKKSLEDEVGFKIFMFHTALDELKPKDLEKMESSPISLLPRGFDYYAGGHVHIIEKKEIDGYKNIVYPGPLFPNSFSEMEKLGRGGFYVYDNGNTDYRAIELAPYVKIDVSCDGKEPSAIETELLSLIEGKELKDAIVTIRLKGTLASGRPTDIDFRRIFSAIQEKGVYFVMKNTNLLKTKEMEEIKIEVGSVEEVESKLIDEHAGRIKLVEITLEEEKELTQQLLSVMSSEKTEGEKVADFDSRLAKDIYKLLKL